MPATHAEDWVLSFKRRNYTLITYKTQIVPRSKHIAPHLHKIGQFTSV